MTHAGELDRRVAFYQPTQDAVSGEDTGFALIVTRAARVQALKGGEAVQAARMEGRQPVIITVRRDDLTKGIDNAWQAIDARDGTIKWDVSSKIVTEDLMWVEVQAVQRLGGDIP